MRVAELSEPEQRMKTQLEERVALEDVSKWRQYAFAELRRWDGERGSFLLIASCRELKGKPVTLRQSKKGWLSGWFGGSKVKADEERVTLTKEEQRQLEQSERVPGRSLARTNLCARPVQPWS